MQEKLHLTSEEEAEMKKLEVAEVGGQGARSPSRSPTIKSSVPAPG
ncbi:MAG: hypothetical protein MZU95_15895 [Desulfomicrobium escambiense]|nr:hypothetical protein [Desulfomicrobium escambiense]